MFSPKSNGGLDLNLEEEEEEWARAPPVPSAVEAEPQEQEPEYDPQVPQEAITETNPWKAPAPFLPYRALNSITRHPR